MGKGSKAWAAAMAVALMGCAAGLAGPGQAATAIPQVAPVTAKGAPFLSLGTFDLKALGYVVEEYFLTGTATAYKLTGAPSADGAWTAQPTDTAPYATRVVVVRPADPKAFKGTVAVEWLNVTGGLDAAPDWTYSHREMIRSGMAYVGVSAQKVGVEGGTGIGGTAGMSLKRINPARYGTLSHPGDTYAFDIFSQAGEAVKSGAVLGPLKPKVVLATGESQSAAYMTTYVNAIDPLAKVFDGFYIHSRSGGSPVPETAGTRPGAGAPRPTVIKLRPNLRVPVMTLITETDMGANAGGFWAAQQPDNDRLRIWEMPGASHVDNYMFFVGGTDSGSAPIEKLAELWKPNDGLYGSKIAHPMNSGPQHHYVAQAALASLDRWVRTGKAPPKAPRLDLAPVEAGADAPKLALDANGNVRGGIRNPWVDAPTSKLSGFGNSGGPFGFLVGTTAPFDAATLARLYPGGKADYLKRFDASLAAAVKAGFILPADQAEIRALAAASWPGA